ncbi:hypothetical protein HID58_024291 [Brassica napus]|uniref:DNA repair protein REV1 n=1 Tax=Brassica napus TaxID=3708 RepID=A0ABQ8D4V6_BRANA|nr:hypothetical protein HID58_024291 [Brassica napus]
MKRSIGSNSSGNSGSSKKSKKSNQKTLGAAWGAASRPSSSSYRSSPFSDFGSYMEVKNRKLQDQFETEASSGVSGSEELIFQGVSIFVDGFTIPSHQELRGYMLRYGGRFENYFSRRSVTHIICSNLPDSKVKNLRAFSRGLPVVKPSWIVDSISANRLLGWVPYQLDQLNDTQPKLSAFFAPRRHSNPPVTSSQPETGYSEAEEGSSIIAGDSEESRDNVVDEIDGVYTEKTTPEMTAQTRTDKLKSSEVNAETLGNYDKEEKELTSELQPTSNLPSASDNKSSHGKPVAPAAGSSVRRHSTVEDPNFVENYFKDSFFVSVVIRNRLELQDKPVAVCHSDSPKGTAEISSANYPARAYGVKAGMFVRHAKDLCPQLVIVPYNFEAYEEVADQFYDILHRHCRKVQAVSCDEAFLDVSDLRDVEPEFLASTIRKEILDTTGCSASAGIGGTMLMARLATRVAKPAGQFHISAEKVEEFLDQLAVGTLPGVGSVLKEKLEMQNIQTCRQLRLISKDSLQKDFGVKTGEMLWSYSRGLDLRSVTAVQESKSIGAEVNWGVRFRDQQDVQHFLQCLCKEVSLRLQGCEMIGRTFTLKIKKRKKDAGEPAKYMGCGDCDNFSRSITVPAATDDIEVLQRISKKLFGSFNLDVKEVRGVGLQVSKLEGADPSNKGSKTLTSWLNSAPASIQTEKDDHSGDTNSSLPPMCHLDMEVLENLPPELLTELDGTYGGKLFELIEKKRGKRKINSDSSHVSLDEPHVAHPPFARAPNERAIETNDLMPLSLSQVDVSVLQELPEELRADVLGAFPAHPRQQSSSDAPMETCKKQDKETTYINDGENEIGFSSSSLWFGNPPLWVENFKVSGNSTLEKISEIYCNVAQSRPMLSTVLQRVISEVGSFHDASIKDLEKTVDDVCEFLNEYIKIKVEGDIEEIYLCFRLLKRLAARSQLFHQVYEIVSHFIQKPYALKLLFGWMLLKNAYLQSPASMAAMLSHRLRRVLLALPSSFQRSFTPTRASHFPHVSSLLRQTLAVKQQPTELTQSPARLLSTTQYQYDPYTGEDSFTPDNEGCDFNHWLITMDFPKENPPSREEMISIFEQTCAKGLGLSLEEAKKKIYAICTTSYQGFQATMSIGEVEKFRDLPGVQYIIPDSYVDVENKVYGEKENASEEDKSQEAQKQLDQELTSGQVIGQGSQTPPEQRFFKQDQGSRMPPEQRSFKQNQGTLTPIQWRPTPRQWKGRGEVPTSRQGPSFQWSFNRDQGNPTLGQRQVQGNQIPSFQGSFNQGQGTPFVGKVQDQESQTPSSQRSYNQGQGTPMSGQGQGSQAPSYHMGYSQGQGAQAPPYQGSPSSYGQGAVANYNQGPPQGNFIQGTHENYNQMGRGNNTPQSGGNSGPSQGAGSPGFGHGQGQLLSPYQGSYNQGQGTPMPGQVQGGHSYQIGYSQGQGAPVPPYQVNYNHGTPGNNGQWAFVNYNQGPPHCNFLQGPHQNYNQGGQWNYSPPNGVNYGPPQFGNQIPQYQLSYNQGQGAPFPGQWQCPGCGMLLYQGSYNQGQGTPNHGQWQGFAKMPSYQARTPSSSGQGTSANFNQGIPVHYNQKGEGNYNLQSGGSYGNTNTHGSAGFSGQGQNQRNVAGDWSNNNNPKDPIETGKLKSQASVEKRVVVLCNWTGKLKSKI